MAGRHVMPSMANYDLVHGRSRQWPCLHALACKQCLDPMCARAHQSSGTCQLVLTVCDVWHAQVAETLAVQACSAEVVDASLVTACVTAGQLLHELLAAATCAPLLNSTVFPGHVSK